MSFVTLAVGVGSAVGGKLINGALAGGGDSGGMAAMPPQPINNTANFAPVNFGGKFLGDAAVKAAPAVIAAENQSWTKFLPWIVAGVVAAALAIAVALKRREK